MVPMNLKVWFYPKGDFLEVLFDSSRPGVFGETADARVTEKVDEKGNILGFSILRVSSIQTGASPIELALN